MFNFSVSSVQKCVTESTTSSNCSPAMEADTTTGKTKIGNNFINSQLRLNMHLDICQKMESMRIINSHNIHLLVMCNTYRF